MIRKASPLALLTAGAVLGASLTAGIAHADPFTSILKGGGIAILIKQFNRPINDALNKLTGSAGASSDEATKVVPIISIGQGGYAGAVQVSGPREQVDRVQAVGQLETSLGGNRFRLKALIPIDTTSPSGKTTLRRIKGVGVSALIDIKV